MSEEAVQEPKVYVMGLSVDTQEDDLRKVFDSFGDIKDIYIKPKDTFAFAFVTYYEMDHATRAVSDANGQNVCGKRIKCDLARPRNRNNNGPRGGPGGNRQQGGSRACFKCQQEGHFARECPNADTSGNDRRGGYNNNGGNGGNYSNNNYGGGRNDYNSRGGNDYNNRGSNNNDRRSRSKSRSHSPKRNNNTSHTQKRSVSRSHSRSPIRNKNMQQRRPSPTRSDSCKRKNSRSRSRSVEKKTTVRRRSPSHSRSRS